MRRTFNSPIMMSLCLKRWGIPPTLAPDSQQQEDGTPQKPSLPEWTLPDVPVLLREPKRNRAAWSVSNMGKLLPCGHREGPGSPEASDFQSQLKGPRKCAQGGLQQGQNMEKQGLGGRSNTVTSWASYSLLSPLSSTEPSTSTKRQSVGVSLTGCRPAQRWAEVFLLFWQKWSGWVCTHESHPTRVQFSLGFTCIMKDPKFPSRYRIFGLLRMSLFSPLGVVSMTTFKLVMCYTSSIHMRCAYL